MYNLITQPPPYSIFLIIYNKFKKSLPMRKRNPCVVLLLLLLLFFLRKKADNFETFCQINVNKYTHGSDKT